jgi:hypothetical protein
MRKPSTAEANTETEAGKSVAARPEQVHNEEDQRKGEKYVDEKARHMKCDKGEHPYDHEEKREE